MASDREEDESSRSQSDSSADDSDTQDSDTMPRAGEAAGLRRKSIGASGKKADPNREKRKKAKRACRPCQVAHLTCGKFSCRSAQVSRKSRGNSANVFCAADERPCSRCVKRGCSHLCKDGVRKKAKYLADTPAEALTQELGTRGRPPVSNSQSFVSRSQFSELPGGVPRNPFGQPSPYNTYPTAGQLSQPMGSLGGQAFGNAPGVLPPNYNLSAGSQPLQLQNYGSGAQQNPSVSSDPMQTEYGAGLFAPFDSDYLDNLNFENRFAAAEFGMLGTMTSGIGNSPPSDSTGAFHSRSGTFTPNTTTNSFAQSPIDLQQVPFQPNQGGPQWSKDGQQSTKFEPGGPQTGTGNQDSLDRVVKQEAPAAFAIGSSAYPSPSSGSSAQGTKGGNEDGATARNTYTNFNQQLQSRTHPDLPSRRQQPPTSTASTSTITPTQNDQTMPSRRHRNPSEVYSNVTQPYSYTAGFHSLTALIQGRFSPRKTAHIAKALAAIRPSFISCTMRLNRDDLVFMEKCLQRTLWGLEEVISATGTPTIICRRTGEVVAAGKEFSILTGWSKDVLLGREPNLNINKGGDSSEFRGTGASSRGGQNTPKPPDQKPYTSVNIVNLLDDESACDFFDDYAHLAFGDSRGTVTTPCKLLRYKTAQDTGLDSNIESEDESGPKQQRDAGEAGMQTLGQADGKVACMLCWTVKRDVFDIPMLFVINVSPAKFYPTV